MKQKLKWMAAGVAALILALIILGVVVRQVARVTEDDCAKENRIAEEQMFTLTQTDRFGELQRQVALAAIDIDPDQFELNVKWLLGEMNKIPNACDEDFRQAQFATIQAYKHILTGLDLTRQGKIEKAIEVFDLAEANEQEARDRLEKYEAK